MYAQAGIARDDAPVVWKLRGDGAIEPVEVALGITDHSYTELTKGSLKPGDDVVTSSIGPKTSSAPGAPRR
jgi:multidrug efflux pump subunit AcrA (membrane-fusion protein)